MAYLSKEELKFLTELKDSLGESEGLTERVWTLWEIVEKHENKRTEHNKVTAKFIAEKRKTNKNYGRSLDENGKQKAYNKKKTKEIAA